MQKFGIAHQHMHTTQPPVSANFIIIINYICNARTPYGHAEMWI